MGGRGRGALGGRSREGGRGQGALGGRCGPLENHKCSQMYWTHGAELGGVACGCGSEATTSREGEGPPGQCWGCKPHPLPLGLLVLPLPEWVWSDHAHSDHAHPLPTLDPS